MAKPNKAKTHHSFLRNDALRCNVPNDRKTGKRGKKILQAVPPIVGKNSFYSTIYLKPWICIDFFPLFSFQFYHAIGGVHKVLSVFDGDDGVACVAESVNEFEQLLDVFLMQPAGGFVKEE